MRWQQSAHLSAVRPGVAPTPAEADETAGTARTAMLDGSTRPTSARACLPPWCTTELCKTGGAAGPADSYSCGRDPAAEIIAVTADALPGIPK
jgi:hypothetical protein